MRTRALAGALAAAALALGVPAAAPAANPQAAASPLPPQGLYEGCAPKSKTLDCAARMQEMSAAGFKYVLNYSAWYGSSAQILELADQAAAADIKLIWPLNHHAWRDEGELAEVYPGLASDSGGDSNDEIRDYAISLVKDHPATWGFYVGDEQDPTVTNITRVKALSQQVEAIAPSKPTLFVTLPHADLESRLAPFLPAVDFGGADYYPVGLEPDLSRFPEVASDTRRLTLAQDRQSVMVLQSFSWAQYYPTVYPDAPFPSRAEMQAMRDMAISHAQPQMMLWYSYHDLLESPDPAGNWASLRGVAFSPHIRIRGLPQRCAGRRAKLTVTVRARSAVRMKIRVDGKRRPRAARAASSVSLRGLRKGRHTVKVVATDHHGRRATSTQRFRRCG